MKPGVPMPKADNLAWVFSDKVGLRQRLLQEINFRTVHFTMIFTADPNAKGC